MHHLRWFAGLAIACLAIVGSFSANAQAPQKLRFQASFPPSSSFFDTFRYWSERVKVMSGGRLDIEVLPAGTIVPAFEVLDAVHKQVIDGGHTAAAYWTGKNRAATLFGPTPGGPFGFDILDYQGWLHHGGGNELYNEFYQVVLQRNVVPIPLGTVANQALGWFKRPVKSWEDLKGRKCRETGLTAEVYNKSGGQKADIPPGEVERIRTSFHNPGCAHLLSSALLPCCARAARRARRAR